MEKTEDFKKEFEEHLKKQQSKFETDYSQSVNDLRHFLINYSIKDSVFNVLSMFDSFFNRRRKSIFKQRTIKGIQLDNRIKT